MFRLSSYIGHSYLIPALREAGGPQILLSNLWSPHVRTKFLRPVCLSANWINNLCPDQSQSYHSRSTSDTPVLHLIALDFSKAFDTVRHSTLLDKCRHFPLLDSLYNWLAKYLEDRQHITKFGGMLSDLRRITASIVQGSGIGPTAFVLTASDLRALSLLIFLNKYADDCYLIVPPDQASCISSELKHIEKWAQDNNLKLNVLKTKEMIVRRPRTKLSDIPLPSPGIERVSVMKILGVWYEEDFSFRGHVKYIVTKCNQSLSAVRTLMAQGSMVPICGMSPRQQLYQESCMRVLSGGECWLEAVDTVSKHCSQKW